MNTKHSSSSDSAAPGGDVETAWRVARALWSARKNSIVPLGGDEQKYWEKHKGCLYIDAQHAIAALSAPKQVGVVAYPTGTDREVLQYLMQQFDAESWVCERCGNEEDTASMDSADYLRKYLAAHPFSPQPAPQPVEGEENCESGSPECGPVEHWDSEGVPLCRTCWDSLPRVG